MVDAIDDRATESMLAKILNRSYLWVFLLQPQQDFPSAIATAVIDHNDFVGDIRKPELQMQMLDRRGDATFFIPRGMTTERHCSFGAYGLLVGAALPKTLG